MPVSRVLETVSSDPDLARDVLLRLIGPCVVVSQAGTITNASLEAAELLAVEPRFLIGKPIQAFAPLAHRPAFRDELTRLARGTGHRTFFTRLERRGGVAFDAEVRAAPVEAAGEPSLIVAFRDVTTAVQTEEHLWELNADLERRIADRTAELEVLSDELERRRAYLETILEHIPAGIFIADAATGDVTVANERARTIAEIASLGTPLPTRQQWSSVIGTRADGAAYTADDWPLARALRGERVLSERVTVHRPQGRRTVLEISAAPVREASGSIVAAVALFQDVTAADRRLRAASEFVANAAHELRTPLAAIVSGIEVLESGAKEVPAERDRFLRHIEREADRLTRLSGALLQLARLQSGVEEARTEIIELAPVLAAVAAGLRPADGVRVGIRCAPSAAVIASRGLLEQALTSIATNAARYTGTGRITLSVAHPNGGVRIRIRDTGSGMAPEVLGHAGERFYRGDPTGPAGFGLGLAIARESVEAMGGSLVLTSDPGAGTTADVHLPSARLVTS